MKELRILALNGFLGYGYTVESLMNGMKMHPDYICADAGSSDPGPYYLGSGNQLVSPSQVYRDLFHVLPSALETHTPIIIGSAGTAGAEPHLQSFLNTLNEVSSDLKLQFNAAVIHSDISKERIIRAFNENRIIPMPGAPELTLQSISSSVRIVGQMGTEPVIRALQTGVEFIAAGRACDTSLFAAPALMHGFDPGLSIHMGKILECGALCAVPAGANDCLLGILSDDHFLIRSVNPLRKLTINSVAAHSLYEQSDPTKIVEPEGTVDLSAVKFSQVDDYTVRVSGSRFIPSPKGISIKLEGAATAGFRVLTIAGVRDPLVIANLDEIEKTVRSSVEAHVRPDFKENGYHLNFRYYGHNAVLGSIEPAPDEPVREVGVLIEVIASTNEAASAILALARSSFLHCHFPGRKTTAGNAAFPFSPSDIKAGAVYEFSIYHLIYGEIEQELFPVHTVRIGGSLNADTL